MTDEPGVEDDGDSPPEPDREAPLSELAARATQDRPTDESLLEDVFERESVAQVDTEELWEQIDRDEPSKSAGPEPEMREIDKSRYCHRCPHFSRPPAVRCEHEGTRILELSSVETFRVVDCPVVLEEEALEETW